VYVGALLLLLNSNTSDMCVCAVLLPVVCACVVLLLLQLVFAVVSPGAVLPNLVAGAIAEAGAQQAGDLMQVCTGVYRRQPWLHGGGYEQ
jgi:uncharacterized oligopeptide transporter (OPT) family protein